MKPQLLTTFLTAGAIALGGLSINSQPSQSQPAPGQRGFWCDTSSDIPTTMYQNSQDLQEPWIRWTSDAFSASGYDPVTRCQQVSGRLETYRTNQQLKYITVGIMNQQSVVCTASQVNGRCEDLIYTLKPGQDAVKTLNNLLVWREARAGAPSLYESGEIPYIDVSERLREDSDNVTPPVAPNVEPVPSQPSPSETREL